MTTHEFKINPGTVAPPSASAIGLTNIRPSREPTGPRKRLLDALTGVYDIYEKAHLQQDWYNLKDAGILAKADALSLWGRTQADILVNWAERTTQTLVNGGTYDAGGILLDGVNDHIVTGVTPASGAWNWILASAAIAVHILDGAALAAQAYVTGHNGSGNLSASIRPKLNSGGTTSGGYMGSATALSYAYSGPWEGVWILNRTDADSTRLLRDGALIGSNDANNATTLPPGSICLGRQSSTYGACKVAGWYFGAGLTAQEESDLTAIFNDHHARFS